MARARRARSPGVQQQPEVAALDMPARVQVGCGDRGAPAEQEEAEIRPIHVAAALKVSRA